MDIGKQKHFLAVFIFWLGFGRLMDIGKQKPRRAKAELVMRFGRLMDIGKQKQQHKEPLLHSSSPMQEAHFRLTIT